MWSLTSVKVTDERYPLLTNTEYTVGRKDTDILITNDPSISRKHATVKVNHPDTSLSKPHVQPELIVTDVSKLGTEVNDERFRGASRPVESGGFIVFGTQGDSKYKAHYEPFVITTSCISAAPEKRAVKSLVLRLGGHQVQEWRKDCTLLVMSSLNVTVKVICALVSQKYIVTPQYLQDLIKAYENKTALPSPNHYLPVLAESQLDPDTVSFKPNTVRKTLLNGKIFIFLSSKQFKKLGLVIELAGGVPMLMEEGTDDNDDTILVSRGTCVMSNDAVDATQMTQNAQDWSRYVLRCLTKHRKRMITDPEIGFSILYCSTEKHCNPDVTTGDAAGHAPISQSLSQVQQEPSQLPEILAPNTEFNTNRTLNLSRPDITHIDDSEGIQVKNERATPKANNRDRAVLQTNKENNRKRTRQDEADALPNSKRLATSEVQDEADALPSSKRLATSEVAIKSEPQSQNQFTVPDKSTAVPSQRQTDFNKIQNTNECDNFNSVPTRNSRRKEAVESPPQIDDFGSGDGFESEPRTRNNKVPQNVMENPKPGASGDQKRRGAKTGNTSGASPRASAVGDNMGDFDAIPSRRIRRQRETQYPESADSMKQESVVDDFDTIPVRKSRKVRGAEQQPVAIDDIDRAAKAEPETAPTPQCRINGSAETRIKREPMQPVPSTSGVSSSRIVNTCEGFLSADNVDMKTAKLSEFTKDETMESRLTVVQEKSLVAKNPGERTRQVTQLGNNTCRWKGKIVKNFKRFNKSSRSDDGLQRIIGGSDLVVHESRPGEDLEQMFNQVIQADSQRHESERLAGKLFDFSSSVPSRKRKR